MNEVDSIRLEQFRQLKKGIRGSKEHLIVGIDIAKERHHAFFGTATGKTLFKRLVFENTIEGFERLLIQTEALKVQHGLTKTVFGLEPTANYHKPLGEFLIKGAHHVVLVSGVAVKRNRELLDGRWDKHDTKDSANVADLISQGKSLFFEYPPMALRELRSLLSLKRRLKKQEHGLRVRIRNHLLAQYFPELDRYFARSGSVGLEIVTWCLAPSVIADLDYEQFAHLVAPGTRSTGQHKRLQAVWKMAADSIGCDAGEAVAFEAKVLVEGLGQVREALSATDSKIEDLCLQFPEYSHLLTIPGFGPDVSSKVLAAIGNPFRFTTRGQVLKMAGLDLSADRSGRGSDAAIPVLSKKGKADLRYALYQAAFIASTRNRHFIAYYTNKLRGREKEKGIMTKMRVKLAAKLLVIAWTLMKKKQPFYTPQGY
ncbi:MAG: IS110 family transposase [Deltaproteobacteria bacterium]|nr:MAG: IS110 family transposase [Deltaproteobacteria bacterium]